MSDYFHYAYQCPYLTYTEAEAVHCRGGCRLRFTAIADCREFLREYCAGKDQHWKDCTIAQMKMKREKKNEDFKEAIKEWTKKKT